MGRNGQHAVVIGASIAGMCAARVLSDFYDRVTVYERDELPAGPANRTAVPQGRHVHLLMARGAPELESHLPRSARRHGRRRACRSWRTGRTASTSARPDTSSGTTRELRDEFTAYVPSRPHLEWQIRRRATAIANVDIVRAGGRRAELRHGPQRVTGVRLDTGEEIAADLVVDTAGRGTRLPVWLQQWGFDRPPEDSVDVGISYATHQLRIPDGLITEKVVVAGASRSSRAGWACSATRTAPGA